MLQNSQKGLINIFALMLLLLGIIAGVYLIGHPQIFKSKASLDSSKIEFIGPNITSDNAATSNQITLRIFYAVTSPSAKPSPSNNQAVGIGFNIDIRSQNKIPFSSQVSDLHPAWVRFVFPCNVSITPHCPDNHHKVNLIDSIPQGVKRLAVVNGESTWDAQNNNTSATYWTNYVDSIYVPTIQQIINQYSNKLDAIELWNEQDLTASFIPAASYAYLVKSATSVIKNLNPSLKVITGGLAGGDFSYLQNAKLALPDAFDQIDGIAIHPYHIPDEISKISLDLNNLQEQLQDMGINKPIWVTEVGIQEFSNSSSPKNQSEFLTNAFNQLINIQPPPEVALWYAFTDLMGGYGGSNWGLVDGNGNIKPSGEAFKTFTAAETETVTPSFPTHFKVANSQEELSSAAEQIFDQNNKEVSWSLSEGNGLKTLFLQFKVNNSWQDPISASITLAAPTATPTPIPSESASPTPSPSSNLQSPTPTPTHEGNLKNCNLAILCKGFCQAPVNTCARNNGLIGECIFTQPLPCKEADVPKQPCTLSNCKDGFACKEGRCVTSSTPRPTPLTKPKPTPIFIPKQIPPPPKLIPQTPPPVVPKFPPQAQAKENFVDKIPVLGQVISFVVSTVSKALIFWKSIQ